jgi:uncharacterized membrane protein
MTLETNKNLGGVGAILIAIGGLATFGAGYAGLLGLIGLILVLISMKGFADHYNEAGIFNNALYAVIMVIIGVVAFIGLFMFSLFETLKDLGIATEDWANLGIIIREHLMNMETFWEFVGAIILALGVLFICVLIAVIFARNSLNLLGAKTGVGMFGTAGLLMLIGGILTIIFFGLILIWVAWILVAVAFFSIRTQPTQPQPQPTPTPV